MTPLLVAIAGLAAGGGRPVAAQASYEASVRPLLKKYCLDCHSTKARKGSLDLERFAGIADIRKDLKPWQGIIEQVEAGEMPPDDKPQPTADEKRLLLKWVREFLDGEAKARAGDPGHVPLRRLSNAEYDATVRDLTGVNLRPTREFPADGAAGEGFTNAAVALTDISPTLLNKYLAAARDIADHAVLLPEGLRFSPSKTRRDWTDESTARLRQFYATVAPPDGRLPVEAYITATLRHREALRAGRTTIADVATREKLNAKYLGVLWQALTDDNPSVPLDLIRARWRAASESAGPAVAADIVAWQNALWNVANIGNYYRTVAGRYAESPSRQLPSDPTAVESLPVRVTVKPVPGQGEVVLALATHDLLPTRAGARVVWRRPRFEAPGQPPRLLKDYGEYGPAYEVEYPSVFANAARYLGAVAEAARDRGTSPEVLAKSHDLDPELLKRWVELIALHPSRTGRPVPVVAMDRLDEQADGPAGKSWIHGWRKKGQELPIVLSNSSDTIEHIPGAVPPHRVVVHPTPTEFVAAVWKSPITGTVRVTARVTHAHPACGNGVVWWLEHRHGSGAFHLNEGSVGLGGSDHPPARSLTVATGDEIILAIDAGKRDHSCDLTDIGLKIEASGRSWDLAGNVADSIRDGNPHGDPFGHTDTWRFVKGPSRAVSPAAGNVIPKDSLLARWREAATDPARRADAETLAIQVQTLLSGGRPEKDKSPDRQLYDNLVAPTGMLLQGMNVARLGKPLPGAGRFAWPAERFDGDGSVAVPANSVVELRLPAGLLHGREFVVDGALDHDDGNRVAQFQVTPSPTNSAWPPHASVVAAPGGPGFARLMKGAEEFRRLFPQFVCFPAVIPTDEVVSLKMFHREDEPLIRLFLDDAPASHIDRLWREHRYISRQAVEENAFLPQFIGYVTQDSPKELVTYFEGRRPDFRKRADEFEREHAAAIPKQLDALIEFAARAYRRPLSVGEAAELRALYQAIHRKGADHDEAFRGVLARILVSPKFLFRIEAAPPGDRPGPVNDWELATRLSYFLWSSPPDEPLRQLAAAGRLRDPETLTKQMHRMLRDPRVRSLAVEFGTQWIHVRGFDELKEKNERLFPMFDAYLRQAMYEESILFFQDLFQSDRPVTHIIDADHTFLNESLAKHYGIPGVAGPEWRRVDGVKKYGRGGVLGLASVQAKQAGASRTSPILRGNWVVETLLGEKLPRPPANVPQLPEVEGTENMTMRQLVEKHTQIAECAVCHVRIDQFGFALEKYDPIGRLRGHDLGGLAVDAKARLKDGTEFDGIDGLRTYLLTKKKDVVVRIFCRRLLGYALGRSVTLSDSALIDEMVTALGRNDGRVTEALRVIVRSPQFRLVRGGDFQD